MYFMENGVSDMTSLIDHERVQPIVKEVPTLFRKFSPEEFRDFLDTGQLETYQAGQIILSETGEETEDGWLVADGLMSIWKDNLEVAQQSAGDFFGEEFLFRRGARIATVKANTDVALIRFQRDHILDYFRRRPERLFKIFIMNLLEIQHKRIVAMNKKNALLQRKIMELRTEAGE
ncbi:cyclic nucleotide-binding domain-containing protein [Balneolaceae bacterium ANBcel3]|nr:cyclic nucleotide-binding domain-containing protein [Balneolaceae bacterium ANBcel3]